MSLTSWLVGELPKPSSKRKLDDDQSDTPALKKKFTKEMNQTSFDWYVQDANGKWHCCICRESKIEGAYSKGHYNPAKTTNHTRHAVSQSHLNAVSRSKLKLQQPMQKLIDKKLSKDDETAVQYLKCAYYIAKRELPKSEMKHMINFVGTIGCKVNEMQHSNSDYTSGTSVSEFHSALAGVILEDKMELFNDVIQFKFIAMTHVMMDILPFIGRLSKNFQSKVLDFSMIDPLVQSTCDSLEDLVECEGAFVDKLSCFVKESDDKVLYVHPDSESQLETVKETVKSYIEFVGFESNEDSDNDTEFVETSAFHPELKYYSQQKNVVNKVMNKYVGKLVENLQDRFQDRKVISNMNVLLPANIITAESVAKYGVNEFKDLVDHYAPHVTGSIDLYLSEYQQFKRLVCGSFRNMMRISEDGPDIMKFDFDRALKKWKSEKRRKLYAY